MEIFISNIYIPNLFLIFITSIWFLYKPTLIRVYIAFLIYSLFHYFFAVLLWLYQDKTIYEFIFLGQRTDIFTKLVLYICILINLLQFFIYGFYKINKNYSLKKLIKNIYNKYKIEIFILLIWISLVILNALINPIQFWMFKYFIIKLICLLIFIITFILLSKKIDHFNVLFGWLKFIEVAFVIHIIITLIVLIEFYLYNVHENKITSECLSHGTPRCILRTIGTFFNPNQLALYSNLTVVLFTTIFLKFKKYNYIAGLMLFCSGIMIYFSGSRSFLICVIIFYVSFLITQFVVSKKYLKNSLTAFFYFLCPFIILFTIN